MRVQQLERINLCAFFFDHSIDCERGTNNDTESSSGLDLAKLFECLLVRPVGKNGRIPSWTLAGEFECKSGALVRRTNNSQVGPSLQIDNFRSRS